MDSDDLKKPSHLRAIDHVLDRIGLDRPTQNAPRSPEEELRAIHDLIDEVSLSVSSSEVWLRARSDLTYHNCPVLRAALARYRELGIQQIRLDLSRTNFIDSATVALFARAQMELMRSKGSLHLLNPTPTLANILKIVRLGQLVPVVREPLPEPTTRSRAEKPEEPEQDDADGEILEALQRLGTPGESRKA